MSDYQKYFSFIKTFEDSIPFLSIAANSLKFSHSYDWKIDYFWLDPPWELFRGNSKITSARECPSPSSKNYEKAFLNWCSLLDPLRNKKIIKILGDEDNLEIRFEKFFKINLHSPRQIQDSWYTHWYCVIK